MTSAQANQIEYIYNRINNMDIDLVTETLIATDNVGNNVIKSYDFEFANGDNEIEALFLYLTAGNGTSCRTIYVPKLSIYQFIIGNTTLLTLIKIKNSTICLLKKRYFDNIKNVII